MLKFALPAICAAALLVVTNPGEDAYAAWIIQRLQSEACQKPKSSACFAVTSMPQGILTYTVKRYTHRQNCIFFSIYTTNFFGIQRQGFGLSGFFVAQ